MCKEFIEMEGKSSEVCDVMKDPTWPPKHKQVQKNAEDETTQVLS